MSGETWPWRIWALILGLASIAVPVYVSYDLWFRGPNPEKHLSIIRFPLVDQMAALSTLGDVSITIQGHEATNLFTVSALLSNSGPAPILPADYYENFSVSVDAPWNLCAMQNSEVVPGISLQWKPMGPRKYEAEPALLNPGDAILLTMYLTNSDIGKPDAMVGAPMFHWNARIANLHKIKEEAGYPSPIPGVGGIVVFLYGWGLWFAIALAVGFQVLYLHLFARCGIFDRWNWKGIVAVIVSGLVSCGAAECITTYLAGGYMTVQIGVPHWANAPPIVFNVIFLGFLWWKAQHRAESTRQNVGVSEA